MTEREMKQKIHAMVMNSSERYATLQGIAIGMRMLDGLSENINNFINTQLEIISFNDGPGQTVKLREYAESHFTE